MSDSVKEFQDTGLSSGETITAVPPTGVAPEPAGLPRLTKQYVRIAVVRCCDALFVHIHIHERLLFLAPREPSVGRARRYHCCQHAALVTSLTARRLEFACLTPDFFRLQWAGLSPSLDPHKKMQTPTNPLSIVSNRSCQHNPHCTSSLVPSLMAAKACLPTKIFALCGLIFATAASDGPSPPPPSPPAPSLFTVAVFFFDEAFLGPAFFRGLLCFGSRGCCSSSCSYFRFFAFARDRAAEVEPLTAPSVTPVSACF